MGGPHVFELELKSSTRKFFISPCLDHSGPNGFFVVDEIKLSNIHKKNENSQKLRAFAGLS